MQLPSRKRTLQVLLSGTVVASAAALVFIYGAGLFSFDDQSPTEVASPLPDAMSNVLAPTDKLTDEDVRDGRPWTAPDYTGQSQAVGWTPTTFAVSPAFRKRVNFWKNIYAKYTTDEGVLHDPVTLEVYESVEFEKLKPGANLRENARSRSKLVDQKRAVVSDRLLMLQERLDRSRDTAVTTPFEARPTPVFSGLGAQDPALTLMGDDLRYWKLFMANDDPNRFRKAASRIRFQLGQRDKFRLGLYYSGRYLEAMEAVFRQENLPIELTRLPFVESSFNTKARSKVGASGIWQFMRKTAKPYLKINSALDERDDPLTATLAAARFMKQNFDLLRSWPLAITAWNHGPSGVRGISQKLQTTDLPQIVETYSSRTFGFASQNFYACFLAVLEIESDASSYFKNPVWQPPLEFSEIKAPRTLSWPAVVQIFSGNDEMANDYNPEFTAYAKSSSPRIPAGTKLRIPKTALDLATTLFAVKRPIAIAKKPKSLAPAPNPTAIPQIEPDKTVPQIETETAAATATETDSAERKPEPTLEASPTPQAEAP